MYPYGALSEKIKVQNCYICVNTKIQKNPKTNKTNNNKKPQACNESLKEGIHTDNCACQWRCIPGAEGKQKLVNSSKCLYCQSKNSYLDPSPQWHLIKNNTPVDPDYLIRSKSCEAISQQWNHCLLKIWVPPLIYYCGWYLECNTFTGNSWYTTNFGRVVVLSLPWPVG